MTEHSVALVSPGPALTPGLILDISLRRITKVVLFNNNYPAESPALLIVRDKGEDIQQGGVGPALVNLENKEISSEDIMVVPSPLNPSYLVTRRYIRAHHSRHQDEENQA